MLIVDYSSRFIRQRDRGHMSISPTESSGGPDGVRWTMPGMGDEEASCREQCEKGAPAKATRGGVHFKLDKKGQQQRMDMHFDGIEHRKRSKAD